MTRSSISMFVLLVGVVWAAFVSWFFVGVGGAASLSPSYLSKTIPLYSWLFVGPLLLIAGAVLTLVGTHPKAGSILSLIGCFILTVMVGYQTLTMFDDTTDPLIMKPPYGKYAIAVTLTLVADLGAVQLFRLASLVSTK